MTHQDFNTFTKDILELYCKTGNKTIESVFIKLANIEIDVFWKWLLRNNRIRASIINSSVYDALDVLSNIRNSFSYGQPIDKSTLVRTLAANPRNAKTIPIIIAMKELVDDQSVSDLLQPYRDIIDEVAERFKDKNALDQKADIITDLSTIKSLYLKSAVEEIDNKPEKESIPQKRISMLQYLLTKFSDDIAVAAESSKMPELASAVRSGILAKPIYSGLHKYINFDSVNTSDVNICKKWAEFVLKKPHYERQWGDYNHDLIEMMFMNASGTLTRNDMTSIISEYEQNINPMKMLEERDEESMYPGLNVAEKVTIDNRLNPKYLFLVSTFFVIFRARAGMPTGFASNVAY